MEGELQYSPSNPESVDDALQRICAELSQGEAEQITPLEHYYAGQPEAVRIFRIFKGDAANPNASHSKIIHQLLLSLNPDSEKMLYSVTLDTINRGTGGSENIIKIEKIKPQLI